MEFTHFDGSGNAVMVDIGEKEVTRREASAQGEIGVSEECYQKILEGSMKKGDVLSGNERIGILRNATSGQSVRCAVRAGPAWRWRL